MDCLAHIKEDGTEQKLFEHCKNVGDYASKLLFDIGLKETAFFAGIIHDMGKATRKFNKYLKDAYEGKAVVRGSVNHTFSGVRYLLENYHDKNDEEGFRNIASELVSFAVGSHHGLFDCVDENGKNGFEYRINKEDICYEESVGNYNSECFSIKEIDDLFNKSTKEIKELIDKICNLSEKKSNISDDEFSLYCEYYLGITARLLLSAVIEADRRDTAEFMDGKKFSFQKPNWSELLSNVENKLNQFECKTNIDKARKIISDRCKEFAERKSSVYRLNVPTGSGKTLAGLRYALAHAKKWNKKRIIFTSPLLSILEQNAKVLRNFIQDDSVILEHHSNIINSEDNNDELDFTELMMDNWESPIIITTLVQLLNTMFSGKTSCIRRFHSLCDSIIVIDEIQTVPIKMLSLFNLMINFLSEICGTTVLLCSATQPFFEKADKPLVVESEEIVPYDYKLWKAFNRTMIKANNYCTSDEIPNIILESLGEIKSLLFICNKKSEALLIYNELKLRLDDNVFKIYHLSASMCIEHRKNVINNMKNDLDNIKISERKIICISTQVIEAGVDISFEQVMRMSAGMDSIIQAAGRCNRNGEYKEIKEVKIIKCHNENLGMLREIKNGQDATNELLYEFESQPEKFNNNLSSDESIKYYYKKLYESMAEGYQDYSIKNKSTIFSLLSNNEKFIKAADEKYNLKQAFKLAGNLFEVFDNKCKDVVVYYGEGRRSIEDLYSEKAYYDKNYLKAIIDKLKPYTIALYKYQFDEIKNKKGITQLHEGAIAVLNSEYYDEAVGLIKEPGRLEFWEA